MISPPKPDTDSGERPHLSVVSDQDLVSKPHDADVTAADLLLDGYAARSTVGYTSSAPLFRRAVERFLAPDQNPSELLPRFGLACLAAMDLFDDEATRRLALRWVQTAGELGALPDLPIALDFLARTGVAAGGWNDAAGRSAFGLAWRGREAEARQAAAAHGADAAANQALVILELGLSRYQPAMDRALPVYTDDRVSSGPWVLPNLVEAAARSGVQSVALDALRRLRDRSVASGTSLGLGLLARSEALVLQNDGAEDYYIRAIDHLGHCRSAPELARAHLLYGEWMRRAGRRRDARKQLRTALEMFASMHLEAFAGRAHAELLATGERVRRRCVETQDDLTHQEAQVARLAGDGARNSEIALQLFISPSTVEYHLTKVFRKLGVNSRVKLGRVLDTRAAAGGSR